MSTFEVKVHKLEPGSVTNHPDADRLSLITIMDYVAISAKLDDGSHRYKEGDLVVYVPEGAVVPDYLLKPGFWNDEKNMGILAGSKGNRVKAMRLRGIFSQGILFGTHHCNDFADYFLIDNEAGESLEVRDGDDVAEFLGITKFEPPIPAALAGEVCNIHGKTAKYDFDSIQTLIDLFAEGDDVVVTEKLHGTNCQIGYVPGLDHDELFFDGCMYVASKGLGGQGLVLKNNDRNAGNTYVRILNQLLANGFGEKIRDLAHTLNEPVRVFGEVYGAGLQKGFTYGKKEHSFAAFDIQVGWQFVKHDWFIEYAEGLGLATVPLLYEGPFDREVLKMFRDGKNTLGHDHIREGIVIKARGGSRHPIHGRKIGKWVSPVYLLKSTGEEIN